MRHHIIQANQAKPTRGIRTNSTLAGNPASVAIAGEKGSNAIGISCYLLISISSLASSRRHGGRRHPDTSESSAHYLPPKASSGISLTTPLPETMASMRPMDTGSRYWVKNSALLIWPS